MHTNSSVINVGKYSGMKVEEVFIEWSKLKAKDDHRNRGYQNLCDEREVDMYEAYNQEWAELDCTRS